MKKPRCIHVSPTALDELANDDALSVPATIFRNAGSSVGGRAALPYVELTPELLEWLRAQTWDTPSRGDDG